MTVAIIVRENVDISVELRQKLTKILTELVVENLATDFLFTNAGAFDSACHDILNSLKTIFTGIRCHYYHGEGEYSDGYVSYLATLFDKVHAPRNGIWFTYDMRDEMMIDECDVLLTYCDLNYQMVAKWKSGTARAIECAWQKKRRMINTF